MGPNGCETSSRNASRWWQPPGYFCVGGGVSPTACPPGYVSQQIGLSSFDECERCPEGNYCDGSGSVIPCEIGRYGALSADQASGLQAANQCTRCSASKTTIREGATSENECVCAAGFYVNQYGRCQACSEDGGLRCGHLNTTLETVEILPGSWRISAGTAKLYACASKGGWTPCQGGADAGDQGDGYCADGYHGPRCELCDGPPYSKYFDKVLNARCQDCGDVTAKSAIASCVIMIILILAVLGGSFSSPQSWRPFESRQGTLAEGPER